MPVRTVKKAPIMWVPVYAPETFGKSEIAEIATRDIEKIVGRTVEVSLYEITKEIEHQFIKLKLKITKVENNKAYTMFIMHDTTRDYIRSLVRRGSSRVDLITDMKTKDNWIVRIFVMAVTIRRVSTSKERQIRKAMLQALIEHVPQLTLDELVREMLLGKLASLMTERAKKIYPCKKVEIRKSKLIRKEEVFSTHVAIQESVKITSQ
ncbi:MAG: 30S ribosomal protein S3ae [Thermoprotei archaeon]